MQCEGTAASRDIFTKHRNTAKQNTGFAMKAGSTHEKHPLSIYYMEGWISLAGQIGLLNRL
jgi:hypothetical protein